MKRTFIILLFTMLMLFCIFPATKTENTSFRVSAYKDAKLPDMNYTITISNYESSSITGFLNEYDVSNKLTSRNLSFNQALVVTIKSNLSESIPVNISFSPFVNSKDSSKIVPVTYTFTKGSMQRVEANDYYNYGYSNYRKYRFTPDMTLTNSSGSAVSSITASSANTTATLTHSISTIQYKSYGNNQWTTTTTMPNTQSGTLPGFGTNQVLTSTGNFALSISNTDYASMAANIDYVATITLTISIL